MKIRGCNWAKSLYVRSRFPKMRAMEYLTVLFEDGEVVHQRGFVISGFSVELGAARAREESEEGEEAHSGG